MVITATATYAVGPFVAVIIERRDHEHGEVLEGICECEGFNARSGGMCEHITAAIHRRASGRETDIVDVPVRPIDGGEADD